MNMDLEQMELKRLELTVKTMKLMPSSTMLPHEEKSNALQLPPRKWRNRPCLINYLSLSLDLPLLQLSKLVSALSPLMYR